MISELFSPSKTIDFAHSRVGPDRGEGHPHSGSPGPPLPDDGGPSLAQGELVPPYGRNRGRLISSSALLLVCCLSAIASADEPEAAFREGLRLYSQDEFASAREKF